jgi:hypothetical protein
MMSVIEVHDDGDVRVSNFFVGVEARDNEDDARDDAELAFHHAKESGFALAVFAFRDGQLVRQWVDAVKPDN